MKKILLLFIALIALSCSDDSNQDASEFNPFEHISYVYDSKSCNDGTCFLKFKVTNTSSHWIGLNVHYIFNRVDSRVGAKEITTGAASTEEGVSYNQFLIDSETEIVDYEIVDAVDMGQSE